jgi:preprotein translocase subunit Sec61beta
MSGKKKNQPMPASSAGLLRFFEDETEGVKIKPEVIIVTAMGLVVASISLNLAFPAPATSSSTSAVLALLFR